jgi:hypothetical protein
LSGSQRGPGQQYADPNADDERHNGEPDRVHETIVGSDGRHRFRRLMLGRKVHKPFGTCSRSVNQVPDWL